MRRTIAALAACVMAASVASSGLASEARGQPNSFTGEFEIATGDLVGSVRTRLWVQSEARLVPGFFDFYGTAGTSVQEIHAQIGRSSFHYNAGIGANVARGEGVACWYRGIGDYSCGDFMVQFVDTLDGSVPRGMMISTTRLASGEWDDLSWYPIGRGAFVLQFTPSPGS